MHTHYHINRERVPRPLNEQHEESLRKHRKYNADMRARYRAQGLTSSGKVRKRPLVTRQKPSAHQSAYIRQRENYYAQGLNAKGKPFTKRISPEGLANMQRAQAKRRDRESAAAVPTSKSKRIQFVYPLPTTTPQIEQEAMPLPEPHPMHFCPHCGEALANWKFTNNV
jgi:hypothetical protein